MPALPPLSYSLPAFYNGAYSQSGRWLEDLANLGFRWVTLHPTYLVYDETPPRLDATRGPGLREIAATIQAAVHLGFSVRLEPHLDYEQTLTPPYVHKWRRSMLIDPLGPYASDVIAPLIGLLSEAGASPSRHQLTIGSELCGSLVQFPAQWLGLLNELRSLGTPVALGHKVNHDLFDWNEYQRAFSQVNSLLGSLDYVAFSFYPSEPFAPAAARLLAKLREATNEDIGFSIGELGLGSTDITKPWHFDAATFLDADGGMNEHAQVIRREFYLDYLDFLRSAPQPFHKHPHTFWTVNQYDFLGTLDQPGYAVFRDEVLREAVEHYNAESFMQS